MRANVQAYPATNRQNDTQINELFLFLSDSNFVNFISKVAIYWPEQARAMGTAGGSFVATGRRSSNASPIASVSRRALSPSRAAGGACSASPGKARCRPRSSSRTGCWQVPGVVLVRRPSQPPRTDHSGIHSPTAVSSAGGIRPDHRVAWKEDPASTTTGRCRACRRLTRPSATLPTTCFAARVRRRQPVDKVTPIGTGSMPSHATRAAKS